VLPYSFTKGKLSILMYHGVVRQPLAVSDWCFISETNFRRQMEYLKTNFEVFSLTEAINALKFNSIHRPTAVITFDDGYQNVFDVAFPILHELKLHATVFLNTAFVGTANTVWFCRLIQAITMTSHTSLSWQNSTFDISTSKAKATTSAILQSRLKQLDHDDLLKELEEIIKSLEVTVDFIAPSSSFQILGREAIQYMMASNLIEFGAHTDNHTILTHIPIVKARQEIEQSIQAVRKFTGQPCRLFAYPNGRSEDYNTDIINILKDTGITAALTTRVGPNTVDTPLFELRRYPIGANLGMVPFQLQVHHVLARLQNFIRA
jgi:peptidoglycan/xylan/chitin deacetylase (PgdA/CDA1 family)